MKPKAKSRGLPLPLAIKAAGIVEESRRGRPADALLRALVKKSRDLVPEQRQLLSRAVFAYYRWRGWLGTAPLNPKLIQRALAMQETFNAAPQSVESLKRYAVPAWVHKCADLDEACLRVMQAEPQVWIRARTGQGGQLAGELGNVDVPHASMPDALTYHGPKNLYQTTLFKNGALELQDVSSQVVGHICSPQPGETWWDACAGAGGKTLQLSDLMKNRGLIWASDRSSRRLGELRRRTARAKVFNYRAVLWSNPASLPTRARFDGVLLDAPCSGLGTWHRNPHARWTCRPEDVSELSGIQSRLLRQVSSRVKPGGKLVYAVCTLTQPETEDVVRAFESDHTDFLPLALKAPFELSRPSSQKGRLWLWPQDSGGDGMFIAAWRRKETAG